jgi:uroporphyrinogen decarboxylase
MTDSRRLVKDTLTFAGPRRVPRDLWTLPWAEMHHPVQLAEIRRHFPNDLIGAPGFRRQAAQTSGDPHAAGIYVDEWGCTFENRQPGVIGEVKTPLVAQWSDLDKVRPPEAMLSIDVEQVNAFCRETERFVTAGCCPRPFERLQFIRGSQNVYLDLGEERSELFALLEQIHAFYMKELEVWARTDVDALTFMDDWGAQYRGKLTFWGEIDRQHLLSFGTPLEIDTAVRRVKEALYCHGGVIAQCEFGAGARPENVFQVFKTWEDVGGEEV